MPNFISIESAYYKLSDDPVEANDQTCQGKDWIAANLPRWNMAEDKEIVRES